MSDNTQRSTTQRGHQDLLHSLVLLVAVPLLFFAAIKLVGETIELPNNKTLRKNIKEKPIAYDDQQAPEKPALSKALEAWRTEIATLQDKLEKLSSLPGISSDQCAEFNERLALLRNFVEHNRKHLPTDGRETIQLNAALEHLRSQVDQALKLRHSTDATFNWREAFAQSESDKAVQFVDTLKVKTKEAVAQLGDTHQMELAKLKRQSRDLTDQVQALRDQRTKVAQRAEQEIERLNRRRAYEVDREEIQRLLQPFIAKSHFQLGDNPRSWIKVPDPEPLSWGKLQKFGTMQPTTEGLTTLAHIGSQLGHYPNQPRPLGSFPPPAGDFMSKPKNIEATKRAQHLLKTHAQTLIEEGLLAP